MSEGLNHWHYVVSAYVLGVGGTFALTLWSWLTMRRAEARRDRSRER